MERCNARTMEIYRRLGVADTIRAAGLPADIPMDVFLVFSLVEPALLRLPYPSVKAMRDEIAEINDGTMPLEPYQLISQYTLEPLLKAIAETFPSVTVRFGCELVEFDQDEQGVNTRAKSSNGEQTVIRSRYLVGCDGGSSPIRKHLGIELRGEANIRQMHQALFYSETLFEQIKIGHGRHYHQVDDRATFMIVQDSTKHFTLHSATLDPSEMPTLFREMIGMPTPFETLYVGKWMQQLLVADNYMDRRVFIAGDAVHLVIPTGGLGMNTGVGDATDLAWKLSATLKGWGGDKLLPSYESERRPIGVRNVEASRFATLGRRKWHAAYRPNIRENTPGGIATREELVRIADIEQRKSTEMVGAELGYRYNDSPIIVSEAGNPPPDNYLEYVPSAWPGARLPHVWLKDNVSVLDQLGTDFTLLQFREDDNKAAALRGAFDDRGIPLSVVTCGSKTAREVYGKDFLLLRPDLHVAWRGNAVPTNVDEIVATVAGH